MLGGARIGDFRPVIGSVFNVPGYPGLYGAGSYPYGSTTAAGDRAGRLLDGAGATLQALDSGRGGIDQIRSALTRLRNALQSARSDADVVPGRTTLTPVTADIAQTVDRTVYGTVDGALVEAGTIQVSRGTQQLTVGYERASRAQLDVGDALASLASTVATVVTSVSAGSTSGFAADVSALLKSNDLTTAVRTPDAAAIDTAIARIDDVLGKTDGLQFSIGALASAAARIDLGTILLSTAPVAVSGGNGQ
jgi:hypothetical protein